MNDENLLLYKSEHKKRLRVGVAHKHSCPGQSWQAEIIDTKGSLPPQVL